MASPAPDTKEISVKVAGNGRSDETGDSSDGSCFISDISPFTDVIGAILCYVFMLLVMW